MMEFIYKGRGISKFIGEGEAIISKKPFSFFGGIDPKTGIIIDRNHDLYGESIVGKVFIFPKGKGSTVGSYIIYQLKKNKKHPNAIINIESEPIIAIGCIIAEIPLVDKLEVNPISNINNGDYLIVDGINGIVRRIIK
ncbi:MAG: DUF126 domain-containing protein [Candidatus Methanomethylicia archaeon]|nr:DUF126 domain-containing protein [Candidatus Methanomethylicia archaeon]MCQ5340497.1 DUF126 domain-containing protein [Candidatus Methanomethylicia archaeon]NHV45728.1 DUF126 domain-containing protein [Candidatus Verstraetearchaeota archaeon]